MTMLWKKHRFTKWIANTFSISETMDARGAYCLESGDHPPEFFETLERAKAQAGTLNALCLVTTENERLRAELARLRNSPATALVEAVRQPAIAAGPDSWADDGLWSHGDPGDERETDLSLAAADDSRGIRASPSRGTAPVGDSAEVAAISGGLLAVMARNGHTPRILARANE